MNTKFYTLLSIALLGFGSLSAQTTKSYTFTLPQAIEYAFKNQAAVLNAQLDEQIAKNTVKQTTGIGLPQVSGSFSFQDFLKLPTSL